jgi:hypothetical protein
MHKAFTTIEALSSSTDMLRAIFNFLPGNFVLHKIAICNKHFREVLNGCGELEKDRFISAKSGFGTGAWNRYGDFDLSMMTYAFQISPNIEIIPSQDPKTLALVEMIKTLNKYKSAHCINVWLKGGNWITELDFMRYFFKDSSEQIRRRVGRVGYTYLVEMPSLSDARVNWGDGNILAHTSVLDYNLHHPHNFPLIGLKGMKSVQKISISF